MKRATINDVALTAGVSTFTASRALRGKDHVAAATRDKVLKGGLMAPSLIALGLAGFSLYPVAMAWGCEEASRDELVTMNQLLLLSYSIGTLAGPSLTSFLMQRYSDNWMPMVIALVALSFMPVLMLGGGHGRRKLFR